MSYTKQTWIDGNAAYPATAARLSHIEDGIYNTGLSLGLGPNPSGDTSGVTDTAAINTRLAAGGRVQLQAGTYYIKVSASTSCLVMPSNSELAGTGIEATTLFLINSAFASEVVGHESAVSDVVVRDLTINVNGANQGSGRGVYFISGSKVRVQNVRVQNSKQWGIDLKDSADCLIAHCEFEGCGGAVTSGQGGINLTNTTRTRIVDNRLDNTTGVCGINTDQTSSYNVIAHNTLMTCANIGVEIAGGDAYTICNDNIIKSCVDNGIDTGSSSHVVVANNVVTNCGCGIFACESTGSNDVVISGNSVDTTLGTEQAHVGCGIEVGNANLHERITVSSNGVYAAYGPGIRMKGCSNSTVVGNTVMASGQTNSAANLDVEAWGGGTAVVVTGNRFGGAVGASGYGIYTSVVSGNFQGNDISSNAAGPITAPSGYFSTVLRNNAGYNPVGTVTPSVPGSGTAVASAPYDRTFYVTAGAGTCTLRIEGGPWPVLPSAAFGAIRVPAAKTLTPVYTAAPTWVVEGE